MSSSAICEHCATRIVKRSGEVWMHDAGRGVYCLTARCCGTVAHTLQAADCRCGRNDWARSRTAWPEAGTLVLPRSRRPSAEASRVGVKTLVDIGVLLWSEQRTDAKGNPVGGVVVAIDEHVDGEGEIERTYTVIDPERLTVRRLGELEVGELGIEAPDSGRLVRVIRRLGAELGRPLERGRGGRPRASANYLPPEDDERLSWMHYLHAVAKGAAQ